MILSVHEESQSHIYSSLWTLFSAAISILWPPSPAVLFCAPSARENYVQHNTPNAHLDTSTRWRQVTRNAVSPLKWTQATPTDSRYAIYARAPALITRNLDCSNRTSPGVRLSPMWTNGLVLSETDGAIIPNPLILQNIP